MPSLKQIRYFLSVADQGGFTQAAAAQFVAQPALSRQIALLEAELGFSLFTREARGVRLTPAGEVYRGRVQTIEQQLLLAADEGAQLANGAAGSVRLLHSSSIPVASLLPAIHRFLAAAPGARIDLDRVGSEAQIAEVAAGRAEVGLIRLPVLRRDPGIRLQPLPDERLWVALPVGHPLAGAAGLRLSELADCPFVSAVHRERGGLARRVTELCLQAGFVPRLAAVVSRKTSMLDLVGAGLGVAVVPAGMTRVASPGVVFCPLTDAAAWAASSILLPAQTTPLAARLVDALLSEAAGVGGSG